MANLNTDDLRAVGSALQQYIQDVQESIRIMQVAVTTCTDNMGGDQLSARAASRIQETVSKLSATMSEAEEVCKKINKKVQEIEDTVNSI